MSQKMTCGQSPRASERRRPTRPGEPATLRDRGDCVPDLASSILHPQEVECGGGIAGCRSPDTTSESTSPRRVPMPKEKTKDDLLRMISGLLAKAESTEFEAERETFMRAADNMMMKYNIELWELAQSQDRTDQRKPVIQDWDYSFAFQSGPFPEICDDLWSLFCSVASHTNNLIVFHKQHYSGETKMSKGNVVPVIGTEYDLGYMQLLFSSLMTQLIETLHPKVDHSISYERNLQKFREAGWSWPEVGKVMQAGGFLADKAPKWAYDKMTRDYRAWCKRAGVPQNYNHFKTYRRNFATGFVNVVGQRFRDMRVESGKSLGSGMEIALRDQRQINREFMYAEFPQTSTGRGGGTIARSSRKYDSAAMDAGRSAGAKANITINPGKGLKDRKAIGK